MNSGTDLMTIVSKFILIAILSLYASILISQPVRITDRVFYGLDDGLDDRIVRYIGGDTQGRYFVFTPASLQVWKREEVISTVSFESYNQNHSIIETADYFMRIDKNDCIQVISKSDGSLQHTTCVSDILPAGTYQLISTNHQLTAIVRTDTGVKEVGLTPDEASLLQSVTDINISDIDITAYHRKSNGDNAYISSEDKLYINDIIIPQPQDAIVSELNKHTSILCYNPQTDVYYYSFKNSEGVFMYKDGKSTVLEQKGHLAIAGIDKKGNTLLGITIQYILRLDKVILIEPDLIPQDWSVLIDDNDRITSFYGDDYRHRVIQSTYNGINITTLNNPSVVSFFNNEALQPGDFGSVTRSFAKGHDGRVKAINESGNGPISIMDTMVAIDPLLDDLITYGSIWLVYDSLTSTYWLGEYNTNSSSTITSYHLPTKKVEKIVLPINIEKFEIIGKRMWLTGHDQRNGVILEYNFETQEYKSHFKEYLKERQVKSSYYSDDLYLFGTRGGLIKFDPVDQTIDTALYEQSKDYYISYINYFDDHYIMGAYGKGILVFDKDFNLIKNKATGKTSGSNTPASVEVDNYGNYWVSTFDGITIMDADWNFINRITMTDGLSSPEFNRSASFNDGRYLYFGNLNGLNRINPTTYFEQLSERSVYLENATYERDNESIQINPEGNDVAITGLPASLSLNFYKDAFRKKDSDLNFQSYIVSIIPLPDSLSISANRITIYNPGAKKYDLSLNSRHPDSQPTTIAAVAFNYNIKRIGQVIAALFSMALIFFLIARRVVINNNKRNNAQLAIQQEISDLKIKALRSQLNPHFIFNALNSIQYFIQVNEKQSARDYLSKFARLMRSSLESSYADKISISNEVEQLGLYLELEQLRFDDKWNYDIHIDQDIDQEITYIPSMLLQPIVENAIIHGLGNRQDSNGELNISFEGIERGILVTICDNGVGIPAAMIINAQKAKHHNSLSTSITRDRVQLLNRYKNYNIDISHHPHSIVEDQAIGTCVNIKIIS